MTFSDRVLVQNALPELYSRIYEITDSDVRQISKFQAVDITPP